LRTFEQNRRARNDAVFRTRVELEGLSRGIRELCEVDDKRLVDNSDVAQILSGAELFARLSQSKYAFVSASLNQESETRHFVCDRWGHPIHARVTGHAGKLHVVLQSDGPNGRDDGGLDDDIVKEFDVSQK